MPNDEMKMVWRTVDLIVLALLCYRLGEIQIAKYLLIATVCTWAWMFMGGLQNSFNEWQAENAKKKISK